MTKSFKSLQLINVLKQLLKLLFIISITLIITLQTGEVSGWVSPYIKLAFKYVIFQVLIDDKLINKLQLILQNITFKNCSNSIFKFCILV